MNRRCNSGWRRVIQAGSDQRYSIGHAKAPELDVQAHATGHREIRLRDHEAYPSHAHRSVQMNEPFGVRTAAEEQAKVTRPETGNGERSGKQRKGDDDRLAREQSAAGAGQGRVHWPTVPRRPARRLWMSL